MLQKVRARDEQGRLISCATEQQRFACFVQTIRELLKGVDVGGVERVSYYLNNAEGAIWNS
jgi:hypothetical protein